MQQRCTFWALFFHLWLCWGHFTGTLNSWVKCAGNFRSMSVACGNLAELIAHRSVQVCSCITCKIAILISDTCLYCLWYLFEQISGRVCYIGGESGWKRRWSTIQRRQRFGVLCPHFQATPLQAHEAKQAVTKENSQEKIFWRWRRWRFWGEFKQRIWWA